MDGAATYEALKISAQGKADHLIGFFVFQKNFHKKIEVFLVKRYIKRPPPLSTLHSSTSIYLPLVLDWMLSARVSDGNSDVKGNFYVYEASSE